MSRSSFALCALLVGLTAAGGASANDGRDRYRRGYPNLLYHLNGPVSRAAGFRVLPADRPGGADGDAAYRWAQARAIAVVELAARRTEKQLGSARFNMAIFDLSSENGDTPVGFGAPRGAERGDLPAAPRGRHPGGSHDGGLNLDLGYYLKTLKGRVLDEDYAACSDHYVTGEVDREGRPRDAYMCLGPADRLDAPRQAYFVWTLLKLHRERFAGQLLDEIGMDRAVLDVVRDQLRTWQRGGPYKVTAQHLADLDAIVTHDRWEGWQRFHHHHLHLRLQQINPTGPLRDEVRALTRAARRARADLTAAARPSEPLVLDVRLMSYDLERAIEVYTLQRLGAKTKVLKVRYRMAQGEWQAPDDPRDDYRYVFDLPRGPRAAQDRVKLEAEVSLDDGARRVIAAEVLLPRQDPRLHLSYTPGEVDGHAALRGNSLRAEVSFPARLKPLVTSVRYRLHTTDGAEPELHIVDAGWFQEPEGEVAPALGSRSRSREASMPLRLRRGKGAPPLSLVEAEVILSGRYAVRVPLLTR